MFIQKKKEKRFLMWNAEVNYECVDIGSSLQLFYGLCIRLGFLNICLVGV